MRLELKECCDKSLTTVPPFLDSSFGQHCQAKVNPNDDDRPPQPSCNSSFFFSFSFLLSLNKFSEENSLDKKKTKKRRWKAPNTKKKKEKKRNFFFFLLAHAQSRPHRLERNCCSQLSFVCPQPTHALETCNRAGQDGSWCLVCHPPFPSSSANAWPRVIRTFRGSNGARAGEVVMRQVNGILLYTWHVVSRAETTPLRAFHYMPYQINK